MLVYRGTMVEVDCGVFLAVQRFPCTTRCPHPASRQCLSCRRYRLSPASGDVHVVICVVITFRQSFGCIVIDHVRSRIAMQNVNLQTPHAAWALRNPGRVRTMGGGGRHVEWAGQGDWRSGEKEWDSGEGGRRTQRYWQTDRQAYQTTARCMGQQTDGQRVIMRSKLWKIQCGQADAWN